MEMLSRWELGILDFIQTHIKCDFLDWFFPTITKLADSGIFWILLAVIFLFFKKTRKTGLMMGAALVFGLVIGNLTLKPLGSRARPWVVMENFTTLVTSSDLNSFPSGHTCAAFAFGVALCAVLPQKWAKAAALIAAALMGFSRLYVGVHFPSDVIVGALVGALCGLAGAWIVTRFVTWYRSRQSAE